MELGEPRTSLGDIIGNNNSTQGPQGPKGDKGEPGKDGSIGDFPNSLPATPVVTTTVYGFASIEISWTFENKAYYQYEVYASKEVDFIPNTFNLIHQGQTSSYLYQAKPNETWYFKACCINSHGERTDFGSSYATTSKVDNLSNYVSEMALDEALIGTLSLDRGWIGQLNANLLDVKGNFSVTDGNGKRTMDIDSFGNVNLDVTNLKIHSTPIENVIEDNVESTVNSILNVFKDGVLTDIERRLLEEKRENLLKEKADILALVEIIKQSEMLIDTTELSDLKESESNYINSINNLIAIIDKLLEGGNIDG